MTPSGVAEAAGLERAYTEAHANMKRSIATLNFNPWSNRNPIRKTAHLETDPNRQVLLNNGDSHPITL